MEKINQSKSAKSSFWKGFVSLEVSSFTRKNDTTHSAYSNAFQFWLSCLGYAVGYGNIWRFPYMLYKNGGGVFLIPYFICIIVLVLPLSYLEIAYGQVYRRGIHRYYDKIHPRLLGISFGTSAILFFIAIYYMGLISWWFTFLFYSFQDPLPWAPKEGESKYEALTTDGYFINEFLGRSSGLFDISLDTYQPMIMLSILVGWAITFITVYEGLDTAKYAVYITVPLPYLILTILFFKGITLDGFTVGWNFLFKPDWSKLFTLGIWGDAASQVVFSAGLAQNTIVTLASHRHEKDSMFWSTVVIPILNFLTSIFASLALFSFVGYASYNSGIPISEMPVQGIELTFVVYPALINTLPFPQFWSVLFFTMLACLGLSCQYMFVQWISALIKGTWDRKNRTKTKITTIVWIVSIAIFIVDIIFFASSAGYYWVETVDHYATGINLVIFLFLQLSSVVYLLPISHLLKKLKFLVRHSHRFTWFLLKLLVQYLHWSWLWLL